jgi:hypothetical protein
MDHRREPDVPDDQEIDLHALKRALMRRDEAVERFRAAKAQLLEGGPRTDKARQDQPPHPR